MGAQWDQNIAYEPYEHSQITATGNHMNTVDTVGAQWDQIRQINTLTRHMNTLTYEQKSRAQWI